MSINKNDFKYDSGDWVLQTAAGKITLEYDCEFGIKDEENNYWAIDEDSYTLTITPNNGNKISIVKKLGDALKGTPNRRFISDQKDALLDWGVATLADLGGICKDFSL